MFDWILEAAKNFCLHQLGCEATIDTTPLDTKETFIASIEIITDAQEKALVYFVMEKSFVQHVTYIFLEEEESDNLTLEDMALECVNLIVGNAKVLSAQNDEHFNIATPNLINTLPTYQQCATLQCQESKCFIALQKEEG